MKSGLPYRAFLLLCACVSSLAGCGHPIRDLANAAKDLVPAEAAKTPNCPAQATARIELIANLHAATALAPAWDATRPEATASFVISGSPFTADGHVVDLRLFFAKTGERLWTWHALASNVGKASTELGSGTLQFDQSGALDAVQTLMTLRLPQKDGSLSAPVELSLGTPVGEDADGLDGVTSTSEASQLTSYEQDGRASSDDKTCSAG